MRDFKRALYSDDPLDLLMMVSGLMAATEPTPGPDEDPPTDLAMLVETFIGVDVASTTAALHVVAAFTEDDLLAHRIATELRQRRQPMPAWVSGLGSASPTGAVVCTHPLGDGANQGIGVRLADGTELVALVYVDSVLGTVAKDGFVMPDTLESVRAQFEGAGPDVLVPDADPAGVRGSIERALAAGRRTYPPLESDTWPLARPLVEWMARLLPPPTAAPEEWDAQRTDALALPPWEALGEEGCERLRTLVRPLSKAIVASGTFGFRPDPDA